MERKSFMRVVNVLRYNSPSKRQIRRQTGRPKYLNSKEPIPAPVVLEPIKYTTKESAPFAITRSSPGKNLPIYSDFRSNGSKRLTIVRKIEGDIDEMANEIRKVCVGSDVDVHHGSIHIDGNHHMSLHKWMMDLGF